MNKTFKKVVNMILAGGIMAMAVPVIHGTAEENQERFPDFTEKVVTGDELMNQMIHESGITGKPNTIKFLEFNCYTDAGASGMLDCDTTFAVLFQLDESRNLYVTTNMTGDIKDNLKLPVHYILGVGSDVEIISKYRIDPDNRIKTTKFDPQEYGNNTSSEVAVMRYYNCSNVRI